MYLAFIKRFNLTNSNQSCQIKLLWVAYYNTLYLQIKEKCQESLDANANQTRFFFFFLAMI